MADGRVLNAERQRLEAQHEGRENWRLWGPYLAERAWGTVREDYSAVRRRVGVLRPRPGPLARLPLERGRPGRHQRRASSACASRSALWNGRDPILKERAFGLTGNQGNRGEDVKEYYFYLDATPSHSWMRYLYKYPQAEYPYGWLVEENRRRSRQDAALHAARHRRVRGQPLLRRRGALRQGLARGDPHPRDRHQPRTGQRRRSTSCRSCGSATLTWRDGAIQPTSRCCVRSPRRRARSGRCRPIIRTLGDLLPVRPARRRACSITENESNAQRLWNVPNATPYVKDAFHRRIVNGEEGAVNPERTGTKFGAWHELTIEPGQSVDHRSDAVRAAACGAVRPQRSDLRQARSRSERVLRGPAARKPIRRTCASCARRSPA